MARPRFTSTIGEAKGLVRSLIASALFVAAGCGGNATGSNRGGGGTSGGDMAGAAGSNASSTGGIGQSGTAPRGSGGTPANPSSGGASASGGAGSSSTGGSMGGGGLSGPGGGSVSGQDAGTRPDASDAGAQGDGADAGETDAGATGSDAPGLVDARATADGGGAPDSGVGYSPCPPRGTPCAIMPFGDSITEGVGSSGGGYRPPLFHLALQDQRSITFVGSAAPNGPTMVDGVPFPRRHEGHGGYTIDNVGSRMGISPLVEASMAANKPNIVTLMIGTNDIGSGVSNMPTRLGGLLDKIVDADPKVLIVVAQIVPTTNDGSNANVRTYNAAIPAVVKARTDAGAHVISVDMYTAFTNNASYKTAYMNDNLHPNAQGYAVMADTWYAALKPFLP